MATKTDDKTDNKQTYQNWPLDNKFKPRKGETNEADKKWLAGRNKILSGYCTNYPEGGVGACEGTKPTNWKGRALPTCPQWTTCPCSCHYRLDEMFAMLGRERVEMKNPEYKPEPNTFVIPDVVIDPLGPVPFAGDGVIGSPIPEHMVGVPSGAAAGTLAARRTETGRAARGGLEAQVWDMCNSTRGEALTPKQVAEKIAEEYKIPTPSSGAVNAVWDRWEKLGFALQAKKPNRFLGYVNEGTWEELQRMKAKIKRDAKATQLASRRQFRPRA